MKKQHRSVFIVAVGLSTLAIIALGITYGRGNQFMGYLNLKNIQLINQEIPLKKIDTLKDFDQNVAITSSVPQNELITPKSDSPTEVILEPPVATNPDINTRVNEVQTANISNDVLTPNNERFTTMPLPEPIPVETQKFEANRVPSDEKLLTIPSQTDFNLNISCYLDEALKIGAFLADSTISDTIPNIIKLDKHKNSEDCQKYVQGLGYRFAEFYATTPEFTLTCTSPCNVKDQEFLWAAFEGTKKGVSALKEIVGYLPKQKLEFHVGQDGDCFEAGYGDHPTGYAHRILTGLDVLCSSEYWWYLEHQKTPDIIPGHDLEYEKSLVSQILTIHEPIHVIFNDYDATGKGTSLGIVNYNVIESFCKGLSLFATGNIDSYGHPMLAKWDEYSITNPPPASDAAGRANFLLYSLNKRFGFEYGKQTQEFFYLYKNDKGKFNQPVDRIKALLDKVVKTDTSASFQDIGVSWPKPVKYIKTNYLQTKK